MNDWDEADAFDAAAGQGGTPGLGARAMAARPTPYLDGLNPDQKVALAQTKFWPLPSPTKPHAR